MTQTTPVGTYCIDRTQSTFMRHFRDAIAATFELVLVTVVCALYAMMYCIYDRAMSEERSRVL